MSQKFELKKVTEFRSPLLQCYNNFTNIFRGKGGEVNEYLKKCTVVIPLQRG